MILVWCRECGRFRRVMSIEPFMLRLDCGHDIKLGGVHEAGEG